MRRKSPLYFILYSGLFAIFAALYGMPGASAQQELRIPPGEWRVGYHDDAFGRVEGVAFVSETGDIRVLLRHPETGAEHPLTAISVEVLDEKIRITLEGESPSGPPATADRLPGEPVLIGEEERRLTVSAQGFHDVAEAELRVNARAETDIDRVTVELRRVDKDSYSGRWTYLVDPITGRDSNGNGRIGDLYEEDGHFFATATEQWHRAATNIFGALDTLDATGPYWELRRYPFEFGGSNREGDPGGLLLQHRYIVVFGQGFRWDRENPAELSFDTRANIGYRIAGYNSDLEYSGGGLSEDERGFLDLHFRRGRERIADRLPNERAGDAGQLDALIVEAVLEPGVEPGYHEFEIDGIPVRWLMQFGDGKADVAFIRANHDGHESTQWLFRPEQIQIEVRTHTWLPLDEIEVIIGVNGSILNIDGEPSVPARRITSPSPLGFSAGTVYRTEPIFIVSPLVTLPEEFGGYQLVLEPGDQLNATTRQVGLLAGPQGTAQSIVYDEPDDSWASPTFEDATQEPTLPEHSPAPSPVRPEYNANPWFAALDKVADCYQQPVSDWSSFSREKMDEIWNVVFLSTDWLRRTKVRGGHHAAMVLLRRAFLDLMNQQRTYYASLESDFDFLGFYSTLAKMPIEQTAAIGSISVKLPGGGEAPYAHYLVGLGRFSHRYRISRDQALEWAIKATREVVGKYLSLIIKTIVYTRGINECKAKPMLRLTGLGFTPVVDYLLPRLMKLDTGDEVARNHVAWIPDRYARRWVASLEGLAEEVRDLGALADMDSEVILTIGAAVSAGAPGVAAGVGRFGGALGKLATGRLGAIAPGFASGIARLSISPATAARLSAGAYATSLGIDLVDVLATTSLELARYSARKAEVDFALGASAVLGEGRYRVARAEAQDWLTSAATIFAVGAGTVVSTYGAVPDIYRWHRLADEALSIARGGTFIDALESNVRFNNLTLSQRLDLINFLEDATAVKGVDPGALSQIQRRGLEAFQNRIDRRLAAELGIGSDLPAWARGVNPETLRTLTPDLLRRDDVQELLETSGPELERILAGTMRATALDLLRWLPFRNAQDLETAATRLANRRTDFGPELMESTTGSDNLFQFELGGFEFTATRTPYPSRGYHELSTTARFFDPISGVETVKAHFTRRYHPARNQFVMQSAFRQRVPAWIPDPPVRLNDRGVPTALVMNLMSMNEAGIRFGGAGAGLDSVKLSGIINAQNCVQYSWYRHTYGDAIPADAMRHWFSYRYSESTINAAGYRVTGVRATDPPGVPEDLNEAFEDLARAYRRDFQSRGLGEAQAELSGQQRANEFLNRYFGDDWFARNDVRYFTGYDMIIDVRPR